MRGRRRTHKKPSIHDVGAAKCLFLRGIEHLARLCLPVFDVLDQEAISVVPREEHIFQHTVNARFLESERLGTHHRRVDQIETDRICSVLVDDLLRIRIVLQSLAHLLSILCKHQTIDNHVLPSRLIEQSGRQDHQCVEPAARLVETFSDELGGEIRL